MGQLINGKWIKDTIAVKDADGRFRRKAVTFRDWIKADGSTPYAPEAGRYHLYWRPHVRGHTEPTSFASSKS